MINHITLLVHNLEKSKKFFSKALKPLGYKICKDHGNTVGFGKQNTNGIRPLWIKTKNTIILLSCL